MATRCRHMTTGLDTLVESRSLERYQGMVATLAVKRCRRCRQHRREVQAAWAAAVPSVGDCGSHRGSGQGRGSDAASCGRLSAERLAERGARVAPPSKESAAPGGPGGELGSPNGLNTRWQRDTESNRHPGAARSEGTRRFCVSCDNGLLESRSPRRDAPADRRWRWLGGCPEREPQVRTAVVDGQVAQLRAKAKRLRKQRTKYNKGNFRPRRRTVQGDREGDGSFLCAFEGDKGRIR